MHLTVISYETVDPEYNWVVGELEEKYGTFLNPVFAEVFPPLIKEGLSELDPLLGYGNEEEPPTVNLHLENGLLGRNIELSINLDLVLSNATESTDRETVQHLERLLRKHLAVIEQMT